MALPEVSVTRWQGNGPPTESTLRRLLSDENLQPYPWSNGPGDVYNPHTHSYQKVIYVARGSITFGLPDLGSEISLEPGDRLELSAGITHSARVGPDGVVCLEAHRS